MPIDPVLPASQIPMLREAVVILDCRPDEAAYRAGHVLGALHAQLERDLSAPAPEPARGGRHPLPSARDFATTLTRWGVTPNTHVIAYDDQNGANAASRLWWMLKALGHERVQIVDGGLAALRGAGVQVTSVVPAPRAVAPYPATDWQRPRADIDEVDRARGAKDACVIDVRAAFRYRGESEPIDPIAGHIPGARNLPLTDNLHADGTFKTADELRAMYLGTLAGVAPAQTIVHCGSGVTACHTLLALERAGLAGAKLYVGSWSEWCRNPERPR
jgi:thiosulfate/3-mercaptopyruvate sulfurtransferase